MHISHFQRFLLLLFSSFCSSHIPEWRRPQHDSAQRMQGLQAPFKMTFFFVLLCFLLFSCALLAFKTCFVMELFSLVSNVLKYCCSLCNAYCLENKMKCGFGDMWWLYFTALCSLYRWILNVWWYVLNSVQRFRKTCFEKDLHKAWFI